MNAPENRALMLKSTEPDTTFPSAPNTAWTTIKAFATDDVWAVGSKDSDINQNTSSTFTVHWDGTAWSEVPSPNVSDQNSLNSVDGATPNDVWAVGYSSLDSLVALFAAAFEGLAIPNEQAGRIFLGFSKLPSADLIDLGKRLGFKDLEYEAASWDAWLDEPGQKALLAALYGSDWAYTADHRKQEWMFLSDTARIVLGLLAPPELPPPVLDFKVLPNFCVLAGADLPHEKLVPLFRHCKIKRIDRVFEFELNKRQLVETSSRSSASKLEKVLEESGPLPATVESLLSQRPRVGGEIRIRGCSAIVQPESAEVLDAIRQHSHLKGYLATGAPKGYLLIKQGSNPNNFVNRCEQLGFRINILQS